jgi:hypothetical protein
VATTDQPEELTLEQSRTLPPVNRPARWRYRSAVHAARVLNSIGRTDAVPVQRQPTENRPPRRSEEYRSPAI